VTSSGELHEERGLRGGVKQQVLTRLEKAAGSNDMILV
jgi:hypothetical protein